MTKVKITKQVKQGETVSIQATPATKDYDFDSYSGSINGTTTGGRTQENGNNPLSFNATTNSNIVANFKGTNEGRIEIRWYNSVNEPGYGPITRTSASLNATNIRGVKRNSDYLNAITVNGTLNSGRWTGYYEGTIAGFPISAIRYVGFREEGGVYPGSSRSNVYYADFSACTSMTQFGNSSNDEQFYYHNTIETVKLPSSIESIYFTAFSSSAIKTLYIYATTPPVITGTQYSSGDIIFSGCSNLRRIYVPAGSVNAYKSATAWSYYSDKITAIIDVNSEVNPVNSGTVSKAASETSELSNTQSSTLDGLILTASGNSNYSFSSWKRGTTVLSSSNPYTLYSPDNINGTDTIIAEFLPIYTISASVDPSSSGTISGTGTYNYGDSCTVSATANTGYNFVNWTEGGSTVSSSSSYTFTVSSSRTLVANFELETITISAGPNTSGYGTVSGTGSYSYGDTVSLTANAASGYEFTNWTENGTTVSSNATYSFTATQDRTLVAVFVASSAIEINTTGSDTIYLKNNSNETYTWNLSSGNNRYTGSVSGFELNNLKSIYRFSTSSSSTDNVITSVDISDSSISVIPSYAFYNCTALATLVLSDTLETINDDAFFRCTALTSFTIPSSVKYIDRTSFDQSGWWSNQTDAIMYKDNICFGYKSTEPTGSVSITSGTRVIARGALDLCTGITSISLPNSLKVINSLAFNYCSGLHSLTIPSSVEYIGLDIVGNSGIYSDAAEHTFLVLSDCVVGYKGSQTGRITLPNTTRLISSQAFAFQTGITEFVIDRATPPIYCPNALDTAYNPGDGSCTSPIYVPSANVNTYKAADGWTAVASRIQGFTTNTISASVSPSGSGTISGTGNYMSGDSCTLSCLPSTGYDFVNWTESGSSVSSNASYTFTVSGNRTLVANLSLQTFTISASPNTSGYGTVSGTGTYNYGASVSLVATAASGYEFIRWTENGTSVSTNATYSFTATQNRTLVAVFAVIVPATPLTITTRGTGSVILTNNSDETYTWNLASGTNTYDGSVSGFELNNLKSIKKTESYSTETTYITGVDISSTSITEIPQYGFSKCTYLTSITFPNTLTELKYWAFYGCTSLASITLPNSLVYIRADAFYNNPLTSITIPASVKRIDSSAFSKTQISSFTIPSTVEEIHRDAFINTPWWNGLSDATIYKDNICFGYKTTKPTGAISITSGTRMIAGGAFSFCTGLTSVSLPNSTTIICDSAFYDSTAISSYSLPKVQHIGSTAFRTNTALTSITLPNTLTYLAKNAFTLCSNLEYIHFSGTTPPSDGNFNNSTKGPALMVPNSSAVATYKAAWPSLQSRIFAEGSTLYKTTVNMSPSGAGTISGTGMYAYGDTCTLTASSSKYNFSKWTNSGGTTLSTDNPYSFTVSGNSTINAIFTTKPGSFTEASTTGWSGSTSTYGSGTVYIQLNGTTIATYVFSSSGWTITKSGTWPKEFNVGDKLGCNTQSWTFKSAYSIGVYMGYSNLVLERASRGTSSYTIADSFSGSDIYLYVGIKSRN